MRRTKAEAEETRRIILEAALKLFDEHGYAHTPLNAVAQAAGVTRGAIYWHFRNKEDMLAALMEEKLAVNIGRFNTALASAHIWQALADNIIGFFRELQNSEREQRLFRIIHAQYIDSPDIARLHVGFDDYWRELCAQAVQQGKENGEIRADIDGEYIFFHLTATICGLIELYLQAPDNPQFMPLTARTVENTVALFTPCRTTETT